MGTDLDELAIGDWNNDTDRGNNDTDHSEEGIVLKLVSTNHGEGCIVDGNNDTDHGEEGIVSKLVSTDHDEGCIGDGNNGTDRGNNDTDQGKGCIGGVNKSTGAGNIDISYHWSHTDYGEGSIVYCGWCATFSKACH